jgi:hypothetical protein
MPIIKKLFLLALFALLLPSLATAADPAEERPHWSIEVKGGDFSPAIDNWDTYYGSKKMWHVAGAVGYKVLRQLEVGIEGGMMRDHGRGLAPLNGIITGNVDYTLWPLNAFVLYRAVFSERQWIVPYAGGGWTRMFYREKIELQETVKGSADGYHGRAGIQILLDNADTSASNNLFLDFGIRHTYLFAEAEYMKVNVTDLFGNSLDLGGTSILGGLLFEF